MCSHSIFKLRHSFTDLLRDLTWITMPGNRAILFKKKKKKGRQNAVHSTPGGTQELETGVLVKRSAWMKLVLLKTKTTKTK